ncbi:MAG: hypothetical protein IJ727_01945 [Treponema sp.]|nr:hypothetical protein [Treponema sp.]
MRKFLFTITALLCLAGTSLAAENAGARSVHTIGFNIPIQSQTWEYEAYRSELGDYDVELDMSLVGFDFFYNHLSVSDSRFSRFIDCEIGYASMSVDKQRLENSSSIDPDMGKLTGFDTRFLFGIGFAPVNLEKFILAIHGTFGVSLTVVEGKQNGITSEAVSFNTFLGANAQGAFRLSDTFGLTGGIHMYTNLVGGGVFAYDIDDSGESCLIKSGDFNIDLKFGISWIL